VLKNHEMNQRQANVTEMTPTAWADMLKNPQMAMQKLLQV